MSATPVGSHRRPRGGADSVISVRADLVGPLRVSGTVEFLGRIWGDLTVVSGGRATVRGTVHGSVFVECGGFLRVVGHVAGPVDTEIGAEVAVDGRVDGPITGLDGAPR